MWRIKLLSMCISIYIIISIPEKFTTQKQLVLVDSFSKETVTLKITNVDLIKLFSNKTSVGFLVRLFWTKGMLWNTGKVIIRSTSCQNDQNGLCIYGSENYWFKHGDEDEIQLVQAGI